MGRLKSTLARMCDKHELLEKYDRDSRTIYKKELLNKYMTPVFWELSTIFHTTLS
ncbi:hypothetical protein DPMN_193510 [Dreissena polymorpha]|uniref:Uncharacterized protein n=1 Tax=Dreissena polymorpha TaxID=45954 RepID=A0A9D3Y0J4_DREPO|nr:hypothetical protein DPMN_193510 [Dreissena polymorpha]